jgi:hypothetical protein
MNSASNSARNKVETAVIGRGLQYDTPELACKLDQPRREHIKRSVISWAPPSIRATLRLVRKQTYATCSSSR